MFCNIKNHGAYPKGYYVRAGRDNEYYKTMKEKYLNTKINFEYEPKTFHLGDCRSYTPDFHLIDTDEWVEVKGNIYGEHQKENMNLFSKNHKFKMIFWQDLSVMCGFTHPNYIRYCKRRNIDVVEYLANKDYY